MRALVFLVLTLGVLLLPQIGAAQAPAPPPLSEPADIRPTPDGPGAPTPPTGDQVAPEATPPADLAKPEPAFDRGVTGFTGIVLDHETGQPVADAAVSITPGDLKTSSDAEGKFTLEVADWEALPKDLVPPGVSREVVPEIGRVTVTVEAARYGAWTTKNQYVHKGLTVRLEVHLYSTPFTQDYRCIPDAIAAVKPECADLGEPTSGGADQEAASAGAGGEAVASSCSGYYSNVAPPPTIRIYHNNPNGGDGQIWTRDFKTYVKESLPREWISSWDLESLQAGAMAVRNYAWY